MPSSRRSRRRPYAEAHQELDVEGALRGVARTESGADGAAWTVRRVGGSDKAFRCPGCDQLIEPGTPHVVAWAADHLLGADAALSDRRHWHSACWQARDRRRPTRR
jgi:hypothetical protein